MFARQMKRCGYLGIIVLLSLSLWVLGNSLCGTTFSAPVDFPKKEITVIVSLAAGGGTDVVARAVGKTMSKYLGVPMVVVNMPGGGGVRGYINLYHSAPDGYTIGWGVATALIDQILEKRDYDNKKYVYIGRPTSTPSCLYVKADSPFRSVKDFKTFGKPLRFSTFSLTSNSTVAAMIIANREGFPLDVIGGYQSGQAAILALVRGEVELAATQPLTGAAFVRTGQLRPILTMGQKRLPVFPDTPTVVELGHPDVAIVGTVDYWLMAPPGTPKARIQVLEDAFMKTVKDPEFLEWAKNAGVEPGPLGAEETTKLIFDLFKILEQYKGDIEKYVKK